jgi:hypothetical protein
VFGCKPCLGQGVFDKGAKRLLGLTHAQLGLPYQLHAQGRKHGLQLGQFAAVIGCQNNFHGQNGRKR